MYLFTLLIIFLKSFKFTKFVTSEKFGTNYETIGGWGKKKKAHILNTFYLKIQLEAHRCITIFQITLFLYLHLHFITKQTKVLGYKSNYCKTFEIIFCSFYEHIFIKFVPIFIKFVYFKNLSYILFLRIKLLYIILKSTYNIVKYFIKIIIIII